MELSKGHFPILSSSASEDKTVSEGERFLVMNFQAPAALLLFLVVVPDDGRLNGVFQCYRECRGSGSAPAATGRNLTKVQVFTSFIQ